MVGISRAIHEIAIQCMEEGKKRDDLMTEMAQVGKIWNRRSRRSASEKTLSWPGLSRP